MRQQQTSLAETSTSHCSALFPVILAIDWNVKFKSKTVSCSERKPPADLLKRGIVIVVTIIWKIGSSSRFLFFCLLIQLPARNYSCETSPSAALRHEKEYMWDFIKISTDDSINESSKNNLASISYSFHVRSFSFFVCVCCAFCFYCVSPFSSSCCPIGISIRPVFTELSCFIYVFRQREFQLIRNYFYFPPIDPFYLLFHSWIGFRWTKRRAKDAESCK